MTFSPHGKDLFGNTIRGVARSPLKDKFLFPPFSVLDAKSGDWQKRKRAWLSIGLKSELGREKNNCGTVNNIFKRRTKDTHGAVATNRTSIFDPVLCETAYRWFCPPEGLVLDPFAGGSVRGVIAALMGFEYTGVDLRPEQVEANKEQADELCPDHKPRWICGDSMEIETLTQGVEADFVFSCPPYGNLEVYSDDPRDLSNKGYDEFLTCYAEIIRRACRVLKYDAFACFVVGNFRDKRGNYHDFVGDTVRAFKAAGLTYYNEAILATALGSACMQANRSFSSARKLVKAHQNVLVFCKGDAGKATRKIDAQGS